MLPIEAGLTECHVKVVRKPKAVLQLPKSACKSTIPISYLAVCFAGAIHEKEMESRTNVGKATALEIAVFHSMAI